MLNLIEPNVQFKVFAVINSTKQTSNTPHFVYDAVKSSLSDHFITQKSQSSSNNQMNMIV